MYSIKEKGQYIHDWETLFFGKIDGESSPVIAKVNSATGKSLTLTADEHSILLSFISYQLLRTPAFRDTRKRGSVEAVRSGRTITADELRKAVPPGLVPIEIMNSNEELEAIWQEALDVVAVRGSDNKSWLESMEQFAQGVLANLWPKRVELLSTKEYFVTSDHPVVLDYAIGLGPSEVLFPIGSHKAMLFSPGRTFTTLQPSISIRSISAIEARRVNHRIIKAADRFVYAAVHRDGIRRALDDASSPQRLKSADAKEILGIGNR